MALCIFPKTVAPANLPPLLSPWKIPAPHPDLKTVNPIPRPGEIVAIVVAAAVAIVAFYLRVSTSTMKNYPSPTMPQVLNGCLMLRSLTY